MRLQPLIALASLLVVACGLTPPEVEYRAAVRADTVDAYETYLKKFPAAGFTTHDVTFRLAAKVDTLEAYESYLAKYPTGSKRHEAQWHVRNKRQRLVFGQAAAGDLKPLLQRYGRDLVSAEPAVMLVERTWMRVDESASTAVMRSWFKSAMRGLESQPYYGLWLSGIPQLVHISQPGESGAVTGLLHYRTRFAYFDRAIVDGHEFGPTAVVDGLTFYRLPR